MDYKAIINVQSQTYSDCGFTTHDWILDVTFHDGGKRSFYLGQDEKFCSRVLRMTGRQVAKAIGSNDLTIEKTRYRLARFIIDTLELDAETLQNAESWALCCQ